MIYFVFKEVFFFLLELSSGKDEVKFAVELEPQEIDFGWTSKIASRDGKDSSEEKSMSSSLKIFVLDWKLSILGKALRFDSFMIVIETCSMSDVSESELITITSFETGNKEVLDSLLIFYD